MEDNKKIVNINIEWIGILKIVAVIAAIYFLFLIKGVLAILFIAFLLSSSIAPAVDWLQKKKIPRALSAAAVYLILIFLIGLFFYLVVPPIAREAIDFSKNSPEYISKITGSFSFLDGYSDSGSGEVTLADEVKALSTDWQSAAGKIFSTIVKVFGGILSFVLIMVLAFYMLVEEGAVKKIILSVVPRKNQSYALDLETRIQKGIGRWLRGQLILSLIVFTIIYVGLLIIGVKYALVLAIIAGLAEFIPYVGTLIAAVPAIMLSFIQAPVLVLFVAGLYYLNSWLESHVIVPQVMGRITGLNPIIIIAVMLIGFKLAGLVGVVLAIPLTMALNIVIRDIVEKRRGRELAD